MAAWTAGGRRDGRWLWPWPAALGTSPWATAIAMRAITGVNHRVWRCDPDRPDDVRLLVAAVRAAVTAGNPVPLYVGDRWCPRHVVLAVQSSPDGLEIFEPGAGMLVTRSAESLHHGEFELGGWQRVWAAVVPT